MLIHAVALQHYECAAREIGIDPSRQLRLSDMPAGKPVCANSYLPYLSFVRLLEDTAAAAGCPDFGVRMAKAVDAIFDRPIGLLLRHADNLRQALTLYNQYSHVYCTAMKPALVPAGGAPGAADLVLHLHGAQSPGFVQVTEYMVAFLLRMLRHVCGRLPELQAVLLPYRRETPAGPCLRQAACDWQFDAPFAALRTTDAELDRPLPARNHFYVKMVSGYIESNFRKADAMVSDQVRRLLRHNLSLGVARQSDIAAGLAMHEKTLQRRLSKEGLTFAVLVDDVRREWFLDLLQQPVRLSLTQIAQTLGYSEQAALTRSCKRWFGMSPSELLRGHFRGATTSGTGMPAIA
jgi:AraC-like DNA-binding protein